MKIKTWIELNIGETEKYRLKFKLKKYIKCLQMSNMARTLTSNKIASYSFDAVKPK